MRGPGEELALDGLPTFIVLSSKSHDFKEVLTAKTVKNAP